MPMYTHNKKLTYTAKILRKNMTPQENKLWYQFLRTYDVRFLRQKVIDCYICDFCCPKANLIIEIDGSQHYDENNHNEDLVRTKYFNNLGYKVLRFSNYDINMSFDSVCEQIDLEVKKRIL